DDLYEREGFSVATEVHGRASTFIPRRCPSPDGRNVEFSVVAGNSTTKTLGNETSEDASDASAHAVQGATTDSLALGGPVLGSPEQQTARRGVRRCRDGVRETPEARRGQHTSAHPELIASRFGAAGQL